MHPAAATFAASEHLRALQAERRALARRIGARLVTFSRSLHAPMTDEPGSFNAFLRGTWRAARTVPGATKSAGPGGPG